VTSGGWWTGAVPVLIHRSNRTGPDRHVPAELFYSAGVERCDECGFDYAGVPVQQVAVRLEAAGPRFADALAAVAEPRTRPAPQVWSPLEYTCHVRDVLRVQGERLALALVEDDPEFSPMGRDERVVLDAYNAQDPATVLAQLAAAATELARAFGALTPAQWDRTGVYVWPTVESRTMLWLGRHTVHEVEHHLLDVARASAASSAARSAARSAGSQGPEEVSGISVR
jgi:hypothetical protein